MGCSQALKLGKKHILHKITHYTYSNDNTGVAIEYNSGIKNIYIMIVAKISVAKIRI